MEHRSMSDTAPLLIELGTDELPVQALPGLARALFDGVLAGLDKRGIAYETGDARPLYSPRRLAVLLPVVATAQPEQHSEVFGPYLDIALAADGQPTRALQGFAAKAGVDWTALERATDAKGERFVHRSAKPGARTADLLGAVLAEAVASMPIARPMRWGAHDHAFARPVHWLVALLGEQVVEIEIMGVRGDRMSRGHRFHHPGPVWIGAPDDYVEALRAANVLVDPDERRARIVAEVERAAAQSGGRPRIDPGNLEQVNCLVEWPVAIACSFDRDFLAVPAEALIATMEANQKFFPVLDAGGALTAHFVGVANIQSRDQAEVRKGYERVIRPRFADARFFFDEDLRQGLEAMGSGLASVTYQAKLGTLADKVTRVSALAAAVAAEVGVDPALARRAAQLSKNDLQSRLVGEFPELQGIAGRHYATLAGEPAEVAAALDEAYMPRFAGDAIAPSQLGRVLAIAERLDTLAGGFAAGLKPTGNKDPFALRRNALGLARTLIEGGVELDLVRLVADAAGAFDAAEASLAREILDFILDRLRGYYADQDVSPQEFEAVAAAWTQVAAEAAPANSPRARTTAVGAASAATPADGTRGLVEPVGAASAATARSSLADFDRRLKAITTFAKLPEAQTLAAANKRSRNILRKAGIDIPRAVDPKLFAHEAERALHVAVDQAIADTDPLLAAGDYVTALTVLAKLRPQVDAFFDEVMVNADDPAVRGNRLALLQRLSDRLGSVAAIEHLSL
jgi:glycyl-tRNA synthetase beta chain